MVIFPVRVPLDSYRGAKLVLRERMARRNALAKRLERYINDAMTGHEVRSFFYGQIADEIGADEAMVEDILSWLDAGNNGFTVCTREYWQREFATDR